MNAVKASRVTRRTAISRKPPLALRRRFGESCTRLSEALETEKKAGRNLLALGICDINIGSMRTAGDVKRVCERIEAVVVAAQETATAFQRLGGQQLNAKS